jgi:protein-disulfide isomerase
MGTETKVLLGIGLATILIIVAGAFFLGNGKPAPAEKTKLSAEEEKTLVKKDSHKKETKGATVTLVEFLDYECEACGAAYPIVEQILEEYKGKVNFVVRNFPNHKNSLLAANAAEAAGEQGKYWEMYNILFENQTEWAEKQTPQTKIFIKYAEKIGLDMDKFKTVLDSKKYDDMLNKDKQEGIALGVNATPTFFINGEKSVGVLPYDQFKTKIDAALNKK